MSHLTENPELMLEALAILVERLGGTVEISTDDSFAIGPFNLMSKFDPEAGKLFLHLDKEQAPFT